MYVLGIDTSADECSAGIVKGRKVLSNITYANLQEHSTFGGIVPSIARISHEKSIDRIIQKAIISAKISYQQLNLIAVTKGPGLAIALEVGIKKALNLSHDLHIPLVGVNHVEGHMLSSFLASSKDNKKDIGFPCLGIVISGGHTEFHLINNFGLYEPIGRTLDDAAGEAFDKVGRMLGIGYPSGQTIEELAKEGNASRFHFPVPMANHKNYDFSFSGLKTSVLYTIKKLKDSGHELTKQDILNISAAFQIAVKTSISTKLKKYLENTTANVRSIIAGGGVINNRQIRNEIRKVGKTFGIPVYFPYTKKLIGDNGAMIAYVGSLMRRYGTITNEDQALDRFPNMDVKSWRA